MFPPKSDLNVLESGSRLAKGWVNMVDEAQSHNATRLFFGGLFWIYEVMSFYKLVSIQIIEYAIFHTSNWPQYLCVKGFIMLHLALVLTCDNRRTIPNFDYMLLFCLGRDLFCCGRARELQIFIRSTMFSSAISYRAHLLSFFAFSSYWKCQKTV